MRDHIDSTSPSPDDGRGDGAGEPDGLAEWHQEPEFIPGKLVAGRIVPGLAGSHETLEGEDDIDAGELLRIMDAHEEPEFFPKGSARAQARPTQRGKDEVEKNLAILTRETEAAWARAIGRGDQDPLWKDFCVLMHEIATLRSERVSLKRSVELEGVVGEILAFQRETFPGATTQSCANKLGQEVRELLAEPTDPEEIADCFMLIVGVADLAGVDLTEAVRRKLAVNYTRKWGEPDAHGVINHIREEHSS